MFLFLFLSLSPSCIKLWRLLAEMAAGGMKIGTEFKDNDDSFLDIFFSFLSLSLEGECLVSQPVPVEIAFEHVETRDGFWYQSQ